MTDTATVSTFATELGTFGQFCCHGDPCNEIATWLIVEGDRTVPVRHTLGDLGVYCSRHIGEHNTPVSLEKLRKMSDTNPMEWVAKSIEAHPRPVKLVQ